MLGQPQPFVLSVAVAQPVTKPLPGYPEASGTSHPLPSASQFSPFPSPITPWLYSEKPGRTDISDDPLKRHSPDVMRHHPVAGS